MPNDTETSLLGELEAEFKKIKGSKTFYDFLHFSTKKLWGTGCVIFLIFLHILPVAMLLIGGFSDCEAGRWLPRWMIISGFLGILIIITCYCFGYQVVDEDNNHCFCFTLLSCFSFMMAFFVAIWYIVGLFSAYSAYLNYNQENCSGFLLYFSLFLVTMGWHVLEDQRVIYDEKTVFGWGDQLASALVCLRENKILHRDLKPENILMTDHFIVKLADFGLAKHLKDMSEMTYGGTRRYMSPEQSKSKTNYKSDLWAFGLILWEMVERKLPI
ncbi:unnamed protein product, partial [Mesorhabditis belari]|uniref:non-specific serine/threonine protein kinase n=1 Tax=Mesorhabditis belari TaxID=2138241 RepID=A0AAF3FDE8_9BILA